MAEKDISPSRQNYLDYTKGKAKLKNAVMLQPDDKINDYIRKNTKRRFWVKAYEDFKSDMNSISEDGAIGLAPGEGNPIAPTPSSLGSGDKFPSLSGGSNRKKKKADDDVNESYGDGMESFEYPLTQQDVMDMHAPEEFGEINSLKASIHYRAEIDYNRFGIEDIILTVDKILLSWESTTFSPEDIEGDHPIEEEKHFEVLEPHVKVEKHGLPLYPSDVTINFKKSADPKQWEFDIQFGRDSYGY